MTTALKDTPVVMVNGPRQCGKTTLVRQFASRNRAYITLDDDTVLESVRNDPSGFVRGLDMAIVDEVQRAPELLRAIKKFFDTDLQSKADSLDAAQLAGQRIAYLSRR